MGAGKALFHLSKFWLTGDVQTVIGAWTHLKTPLLTSYFCLIKKQHDPGKESESNRRLQLRNNSTLWYEGCHNDSVRVEIKSMVSLLKNLDLLLNVNALIGDKSYRRRA